MANIHVEFHEDKKYTPKYTYLQIYTLEQLLQAKLTNYLCRWYKTKNISLKSFP